MNEDRDFRDDGNPARGFVLALPFGIGAWLGIYFVLHWLL